MQDTSHSQERRLFRSGFAANPLDLDLDLDSSAKGAIPLDLDRSHAISGEPPPYFLRKFSFPCSQNDFSRYVYSRGTKKSIEWTGPISYFPTASYGKVL